MEKLVIDRAVWLRGEGVDESYLLRDSDGKMCCLGFDMLRRGVDRERIRGISTPGMLNEVFPGLTREHSEFEYPNSQSKPGTDVCHSLMSLNDAAVEGTEEADYAEETVASEADREERLAQLFASIGIEVEFIN